MVSKYTALLSAAAVALAFSFGSAQAASITNADSEAHTLIVTEDGVKNELAIVVGETVNICASGCFITMPNGDRAALSGGESVQIVGGSAVIN